MANWDETVDVDNPKWWRENYGSRVTEVDTETTDDSQRKFLYGFTIAELVDYEVLSVGREAKIRPNNLEPRLYKGISRENWETEVPPGYERNNLYALGNDSTGRARKGDWVASNPIVWSALVPCLRLVTKFLEHSHRFPWINALLYGQEQTSVGNQENSNQTRIVYRTRKDFVPTLPGNRPQLAFTQIAEKLRLGICSGRHDPTTGRPSPGDGHWGGNTILSNYDEERKSRIYLAFEIIEPLLRPGLRPSTVLALQFHIAVTLLHELMHVLAHHTQEIDEKTQKRLEPELFFEDESVSEVGASFEKAIFGAYTVLVLPRVVDPWYSGEIQAGLLMEDWIARHEHITHRYPFRSVTYRPVPISFLEELGQEEFWRYIVPTWGAQAFKIYPLNDGRLVNYFRDEYETSKFLELPGCKLAQGPGLSKIKGLKKKRAIELTEQRMSRATRVARKIRDRRRMEITKFEENLPWNIRFQDLQTQHAIADELTTQCHEHVAKVEGLIGACDINDEDYANFRDALVGENQMGHKLSREWVAVALNGHLYDRFSAAKTLYESYQDILGLEPGEDSESIDDEIGSYSSVTHESGESVMNSAAMSWLRYGDNQESQKVCHRILTTPYSSMNNLADANMLLAFTSPRYFRVWHAAEAVRLLRHIIREKWDNDDGLAYDFAHRKIDHALGILKAVRQDSYNFVPPLISGDTPELGQEPILFSTPVDSVFDVPGSNPSPEDREILSYNNNANRYNEACNSLRAGCYLIAESICLELLAIPDSAPLLNARCHLILACIPSRRDRLVQSRRAWLLLRELEVTIEDRDEEHVAHVRWLRQHTEWLSEELKAKAILKNDGDDNLKDEMMLDMYGFELDRENAMKWRESSVFSSDSHETQVDEEPSTASSLADDLEGDISAMSENEREGLIGIVQSFESFDESDTSHRNESATESHRDKRARLNRHHEKGKHLQAEKSKRDDNDNSGEIISYDASLLLLREYFSEKADTGPILPVHSFEVRRDTIKDWGRKIQRRGRARKKQWESNAARQNVPLFTPHMSQGHTSSARENSLSPWFVLAGAGNDEADEKGDGWKGKRKERD